MLLVACVSSGCAETDNDTTTFEVGNAAEGIVKLKNDIKLVISLDIPVEVTSTLESTIELVGSRIYDDVIFNDVIVTLVKSTLIGDDVMDSKGDDIINTGVVTSLNNSELPEDTRAVVVNKSVPSTLTISDTEISDDGLSKDVRGARVDNEAIVGLAVNMLVSDTVVTVECSVVTMVGSINDSKLPSVIKSTTAVDTTSDDVIKDGGLDNAGVDVNRVADIMVESTGDGGKLLNNIVVMD